MSLKNSNDTIGNRTRDLRAPIIIIIIIIIDIEVPLTHNLPQTDTENYEIENLAMEITNIRKLNNVSVYPLVISVEGMSGLQKLHKIYREYWFTQKHLKSGAKSSTITNVSFRTQISRTRPLTWGDGMNLLPVTEPKPTDSLKQVKVS